MNADRELERRIVDFYASEAPTRAPDWALASALATIDTTRQRGAPIRVPWRFPTMNAYAKVAIATVAVIAVVGFGVAMRQPDITTSGEPLTWTPERLAQDWPVPVLQESARGIAITQLVVGNDARWDSSEGLWEPLEYADPVGDVSPGVAGWVDIDEVHLAPGDSPVFALVLAHDLPRPIPDPADDWIAYGFVLDTNGDGAPDVRIGIDNMPANEHRAWRTDVASGLTQADAGPPHGGTDEGYRGPGRAGLDTYYPGDQEESPNHASLRYWPQPGERDVRFYAWASVIEAGRVVATDFAPDAGWLEEGPQPGLPLVGPIWTEEAEFSGDAASSAPDGGGIVIVASLEFTADGRVVVDTGCSTGRGNVTLEPGALRISDLSLSAPTCHRSDTAAFDARMRAVLSANQFTYTIESGVLELTAGPDTLRLRGAYDGPPG